MLNKLILCVVLIIATTGLSGCVQKTSVDTSQPNGSIGFYSSFNYPLGFFPISSSNQKYSTLATLSDGWYAYELSKPPMKVAGYIDSVLGMAEREVNVYYVGTSSNNQKEIYQIRIRYDSTTSGVVGIVTPKGQGYPFTVSINPNKVAGYY